MPDDTGKLYLYEALELRGAFLPDRDNTALHRANHQVTVTFRDR